MGARPLRRAIQRFIEDPLADFVLRAELSEGDIVMVDKAAESDDPEAPEVDIKVVKAAPKPVAVGAGADEDEPVAEVAGDDVVAPDDVEAD
jgi:ATP-dependent Clp protease ATP-binding subunit ClpC